MFKLQSKKILTILVIDRGPIIGCLYCPKFKVGLCSYRPLIVCEDCFEIILILTNNILEALTLALTLTLTLTLTLNSDLNLGAIQAANSKSASLTIAFMFVF